MIDRTAAAAAATATLHCFLSRASIMARLFFKPPREHGFGIFDGVGGCIQDDERRREERGLTDRLVFSCLRGMFVGLVMRAGEVLSCDHLFLAERVL